MTNSLSSVVFCAGSQAGVDLLDKHLPLLELLEPSLLNLLYHCHVHVAWSP